MKTFGVIGLGSIGLRHARNLRDLGYPVRGYDPVMERRLMLNGVLYDQSEALDCDAIIIASPTKLHRKHLDDAAGKAIFVEKPITDFWYDTPPILMVGCNQRFNPCVLNAKKWLNANDIGTPQWAQFSCAQRNDKDAYLRDGVTLNWGAHEIDLALHLLGPAKLKGANINADDTIADILLSHESGCQTTIHLDYVTKEEVRGFFIQGTQGTIKANLPNRTASINDFNYQFLGSYDDDYKAEMLAFTERVHGQTTLGATREDGLAALEVIIEAKRIAGIP